MHTLDLSAHGLTVSEVVHNAPEPVLYEHAVRFEAGSRISSTGALVAYSGAKTGRSPADKRLVRHPDSESHVWWGKVNRPMELDAFAGTRERAIDYLNTRERLYVVDGFAGWHPRHQLKVRVICSRPYHALFMRTMLIRPTPEQLSTFGEPDFTILNAGGFPAARGEEGSASKTSIAMSFEQKQMVLLGTEYAGEMKKGVFTLMNYLMPREGLLSMHCSATADASGKRVQASGEIMPTG
jgi:phosphoenolpyruvate carboxykinase (ATP)